MSISRRVVVSAIPIVLVIALLGLAKKKAINSGTPLTKINSERVDAPDATQVVEAVEYVHRGRIRPHLRSVLDVLGNRLEKAGKERVTLTGTITHSGQRVSSPVAFVWEYPGKLRLEQQVNGQSKVTTFDGTQLKNSDGTPSDRDEDLVEMLLADSSESFLISQMAGKATRFLGTRFRLDDGTGEKYQGPFFDIYQTSSRSRARREVRQEIKLYYFNSTTHLLERVKYEIARNGVTTKIEVQLDNWFDVQGQQVPGKITRLENDTPSVILAFSAGNIGTRGQAATFSP